MNIIEAVRIALETDKMIRRSTWPKDEERSFAIIPSDDKDCCIPVMLHHEKEISRSRCWNPKASDLTGDDWEVFD